jgi:hypothetical protein
MSETIASYIFLALCAWCIGWKWDMFRVTKVYWVFIIMLGFVSSGIIRLCALANVHFFVAHGKALIDFTFLCYAVGICALDLILRKAYQINGGERAIDTTATLKKAADAAQAARAHAIEAAEMAQLAAVHALDAARMADDATRASRIATRESGQANEASRKADEEVGGRRNDPS